MDREVKRVRKKGRTKSCVFLFALLVPLVLWAKRPPPRPVKPVNANGTTYSTDGDGKSAFVVATETSTGRELWKKCIFRMHIESWMEEDVQLVFITEMKLDGNHLWIRDEKGRCFDLQLTNRKSSQRSCPADWQQTQNAK